jgi:CTP synthase (UTP-ammonia lyase)
LARALWRSAFTEKRKSASGTAIATNSTTLIGMQLEKCGLVLSGINPDADLVEIIELSDHHWFLACQFHPEFRSRPMDPHPLFESFVGACLKRARGGLI